VSTVVALCSAIAAIAGLIALILREVWGRKGEISAPAQKARELVKEGEKESSEFRRAVQARNSSVVSDSLDSVLGDLDALGVSKKSLQKPSS
jgi:hypothetical protein